MLMKNWTVLLILLTTSVGTSFGNQPASMRPTAQTVTSWPAPGGERLSANFTLRVNGLPVPVYNCRVSAMPFNQVWPGYQRPIEQTELASFAYWGMSGPVVVEVVSKRPFQSLAVRPTSRGIQAQIKGRVITFRMPQPGQLTVELDGSHHTLHLFADPPEAGTPKSGDANLLYFGPGVHHPGRIDLKSGQTIYIAGGAVVYAAIAGQGLTGVRILGRGILDNSEFPRGQGQSPGAIYLTDSTDVTIDGVILRDTAEWGLACFGCRNVTISRVKEIGFWRYNSDGIDICNSQNVTISDSFVRSFDDSIVLKGRKQENFGDRPERNIRVSNLVVWCDWGRALEIGAETSAPEIADVVFRDIDVLRSGFVAMDIQHGDRAAVHDVHYENIRVEVDDVNPQPMFQKVPGEKYAPDPHLQYVPQLFVIVIHPTGASSDHQVGTARNVSLKDIYVSGKPIPASSVSGFDSEHDVRDVSIENLCFNGRPVTNAEAAHLQTGSYAEAVRFVAGGNDQ